MKPIALVNGKPFTMRLEGTTWVPDEDVVTPRAPWRGPVCEACGGEAYGTSVSVVCKSCGHIQMRAEQP